MRRSRLAPRSGFTLTGLAFVATLGLAPAQAATMNRAELSACAQKSLDLSIGKADLSTAQFAVSEAQEAHYVALELVSDAEFALSIARKKKDKQAAQSAFDLADAEERAARADLEVANARQVDMAARLNSVANAFNAQCTGKGAISKDVAAVCGQDRYAYSDFCQALK